MALAADYKLGPQTFPRGWFVVAESKELDEGRPLPVRFFGKDFALYRGESGKPIMLDAYCVHMNTHLAGGDSTIIASEKAQIEGDSIRCPYHGWRYGPDGQCDDIPYHDGPCPRSAKLNSYPVRDVMNMVMMWHDPEGGEPEFDPPYLKEWDDPHWMHWELDHLGELNLHGQEILDNMADSQHLGPTHGAPCEYFENEFRDHFYIQRQGGFHKTYQAMLTSTTWYTGPGVLLSKQDFGGTITFELICNTPVDDGVSKVWHAALSRADNVPPSAEDLERKKMVQQGALEVFGADFDIWKTKKPALRIIQLPNDGPFNLGRKWYAQFYDKREKAAEYRSECNGVHHCGNLEKPSDDARQMDEGLACVA